LAENGDCTLGSGLSRIATAIVMVAHEGHEEVPRANPPGIMGHTLDLREKARGHGLRPGFES